MSWRLRIKHVTGFTYAGTAHASYNEARMTPLTVAGQTTLFSQVECSPGATTWRYRDYWGTQVTVFDLQRPHQQLRVTASSLVETTRAAARRRQPLAGTSCGDRPLRTRTWSACTPTELTAVDAELAATAADAGRRPAAPHDAGARDRRLGAGQRRVRARLDRGADQRPGGVVAAQGRVPGHRPPDPGHAARGRHPGPVRLRLPATPSRTARSATPSPASPTPGSSGGAATGPASTPPTACRPASAT